MSTLANIQSWESLAFCAIIALKAPIPRQGVMVKDPNSYGMIISLHLPYQAKLSLHWH
jgi:hypothetical protein